MTIESYSGNQRPALWEVVLLLGIILLGLVLRILFLDQPLGSDEVCSWAYARRTPFLRMLEVALSDPNPPLYYSLLHFTMRIVGQSPALMRLPSVFFGVLMMPAVYWCMYQASFPKRDRLYAATLVAVSSMLIYYSQELRAYTMLVFFGVLSLGLSFRCIRNPSLLNNVAYGVAIVILSFTHNYGILLIAAQLIPLMFYKRWYTALTNIAVSLIMILFIFFQATQGALSLPQSQDLVSGWGGLFALFNMLNVGTIYLPTLTGLQLSPGVAYPDLTANLIISFCGLITFLLIFLSGFLKRKNYAPLQRQYLFSLIACIVIPSLLALLAGSPLFPRPQWLLRGLLYIWPLYYMAAVISLSYSRMRPYLITVLIFINGFSLYPYYTDHTRCKASTVLQELHRTTDGNDLIVVNPWYMYELVNYYYHGSAGKVGYDQGKGLIDITRLRESDAPLDPRFLPVADVPTVKGKVYFMWGIPDSESVKLFPHNQIYVYESN